MILRGRRGEGGLVVSGGDQSSFWRSWVVTSGPFVFVLPLPRSFSFTEMSKKKQTGLTPVNQVWLCIGDHHPQNSAHHRGSAG